MKKQPKTYEEAITRLEEITRKMQNDKLPLEEALQSYEEGIGLVAFCQNKLDEVSKKLLILESDDSLAELDLDKSI